MAIFKDYLDKLSFEEVWALLRQGEETDPYREAYEGMFRELQASQPKADPKGMVIRFVLEEPEWSFWLGDEEEETDAGESLQVCGFVPGDEEGYAIGLKPAEVLAGLEIHPETAETYSPAEIAAHILAEMAYNSTMASSAYGTEKEMAGAGLLASQLCMDKDIQNVDLDALRAELGALPKPDEDYKTKYGFLF